jgi:hypothetical protein
MDPATRLLCRGQLGSHEYEATWAKNHEKGVPYQTGKKKGRKKKRQHLVVAVVWAVLSPRPDQIYSVPVHMLSRFHHLQRPAVSMQP